MVTAVRVILTVIFAYAGLAKIIDPEGMRQAIEAYRIVDGALAAVLAYFIPALEVVLAVALWIKPLRRVSAFLMAAMMLFFTVLIVVTWARGINIDCGCFGKALEMDNYLQIVIRDLTLLILSVYAWLRK